MLKFGKKRKIDIITYKVAKKRTIFFGSSIQEEWERLKLDFLAKPNLLSLLWSEIIFPATAEAVDTVIWWSGETETAVAAVVAVPAWSVGPTVLGFSGVPDPTAHQDAIPQALINNNEWFFFFTWQDKINWIVTYSLVIVCRI